MRIKAELMDDGKHVAVVFPWNARLVEAIKRVPSRKWIPNPNGRGGYNRLLADMTIMRRLREEMGDEMRLGPKLREWGHAQLAEEITLRDMALATDARLKNVPNTLVWRGPDGEKKKLKAYQRADIKMMAERNVVNANDLGVGKTAETILAIAEAGLLDGPQLISAKVLSLRTVWEAEIKALYAALDRDPPTVLTGDTPDERREAIYQASQMNESGEPFWLLLNPAMMRASGSAAYLDNKRLTPKEETARLLEASMDGKEHRVVHRPILDYPELAEIGWKSFTIDEFHLMGLSNPQTQGHKGAKLIFEAAEPDRSFVISGTPIRGKPIKLWGALNFLYPDRFGAKWRWAESWLVIEEGEEVVDMETGELKKTQTYIGGIQPGKEEDFAIHHSQYMIRRTSSEALPGMPEKNRIDVWCDMSKRQAKQYREFELDAEWRLDEMDAQGVRLTATNVLSEYMRLKQFADAYCEVVDLHKENEYGLPKLRVDQTSDSGKLEQLMDRLGEECVLDDDDPAPALIFSQFNAMVSMVALALERKGLRTGIINGKVPTREATRLQNEFQAADIDVLVLNTMAGASLNLARAESVHVLDETWVPDDQQQAEDRAFGGHRAMGKPPGRCYYYRTRDTIEEKIRLVNKDKAWNNKLVLDLRKKVQVAADREKR